MLIEEMTRQASLEFLARKRLGFHKDANPSGGIPSTESLLANRLNLAGIYEFSEGTWRLAPFVGVGFGTIDIGERLLGNGIYDRPTAYQLRGGVTVGMTQKLFDGVEYRWTNGSRPYLSLTGVPAKLEVNNHGFLAGVNYRF
jgi:opacity protein-like surface antigen